jgi:exopolysaccharide production protein ExoZ
MAALPNVFATTVVTPGNVLQSLFFVPAYSTAFPDRIWPVLVPGWSLNYEMFFYAVFALGLLVDRAHLFRFLLGALCTLMLVGVLFAPHVAPLKTYTDMRLLEFLAGVVLARQYMSASFDKRSWLAIFLPVGVGLLVISPVLNLPHLEGVEPWAAPAIMIAVGTVALEVWRPLPNSVWLKQIGDASYSLYLSHLFTLGVLRIIWSKAGIPVDNLAWALLWFATALCVCAAVSVVVHQWLEKPLLSWARRLFTGRGKRRPSVGDQLRQGVQRMMRRA